MSALTSGELSNIANATLDSFRKGSAIDQYIQDKPLLNALEKKKKTYSATAGNIKINVKGTNSANFTGFEGDDTVTYTNLTNISQASYGTSMIHSGISVTHQELQKQGIHVVDSPGDSIQTRTNSSTFEIITNLLQDKIEEMEEGWAINFDAMLHQDGTQDAKEVDGIKALITDDPTTGTVGGIDRSTATWWRNRNSGYSAGLSTWAASGANQLITKNFRAEVRQLRRYGGRPDLILAGNTAIEAMESEFEAKGSYTDQGFTKGVNDFGMSSLFLKGIGPVIYDPTLDDESESDRVYIIDTSAICLRPLAGEDKVSHAPARPYDKYVMYKATTWSGGLVANRLNSSGVYKLSV